MVALFEIMQRHEVYSMRCDVRSVFRRQEALRQKASVCERLCPSTQWANSAKYEIRKNYRHTVVAFAAILYEGYDNINQSSVFRFVVKQDFPDFSIFVAAQDTWCRRKGAQPPKNELDRNELRKQAVGLAIV